VPAPSRPRSAAEFLKANKNKISAKTPFEQLYVEQVLTRVSGLNWSAVSAQTPFTDSMGVRRWLDFTIIEGPYVRIAIEVDGYDKVGRGSGMTRPEFVDWLRRESDATAAGYRVIRVANTLVMNEPERCARTVELVLKRERALAARLGSLSPPERANRDAVRKAYRDQLLDAEERAELRSLAELNAGALAELQQQLESEVARREEAESSRDRATADRDGMLVLARYFGVLLVALVVIGIIAAWLLTRDGSDGSAASASSCTGTASWRDIDQHVGEVVTTSGPVVGASFRPNASGRPTFLDIGRRYPARERLAVVIWGRDRGAFPTPPEEMYRGRSIAVTGRPTRFDGVVQVEVDSPRDIREC